MAQETSPVQRLLCRVRLGLSDWREIERVGLDELAKGGSEPEIVSLASVTASTENLGELVDAAVKARGEDVPDETSAALLVAREVAEGIVAARLTPPSGARTLWQLARQVPDIEPQLRVFVGLSSEWDDDVLNRPAYETDIVAAARELLASCD
jgi:hypothetical protein